MLPKICYQLLVCLLLALTCASAQSADQLLGDCEKGVPQGDRPTAKDLSCLAFLKGFVSGIHIIQLAYTAPVQGAPITPFSIVCLPKEGVSPEQARRIVVKYLRDHPEELHVHEEIAVLVAFMTAFPGCKQQP
jgi:hypothetical protein